MKLSLLELIRCPDSGTELQLDEASMRDGEVESGILISTVTGNRFPITNFVPRFVPASNYATNFGLQWNHFRTTQMDSSSGTTISADRFWRATGWSQQDLKGQYILDAGCGAGRFAEIALGAGATVVAVDYSTSVDACLRNLKGHPNLHVIQGDIYALPLKRGLFPFIYSLGVLQHTPDVAGAFASLPPFLAPSGRIAIDCYERSWKAALHPRTVLRPITKRMNPERLFGRVQKSVPSLLGVSNAAARVPVLGRGLQRVVPVANFKGILPLSEVQLREWAILDTYDWLSPLHDHPQNATTLTRWANQAKLIDIETSKPDHLVLRARASL